MPPKEKYTDPELRDQVKEELKESDKGGAPGQWSARKAQMMASEYKKRGGDYNTDKSHKDESQKNLTKWGEEDWQTKEGSGSAKKEDGTEKRYLPKKAWDKMTKEEKQATEDKKQEGSKEGKQFVENTTKAKQSRKKANKEAVEKEPEQNDDDDDDDDDNNDDDDDNNDGDDDNNDDDDHADEDKGEEEYQDEGDEEAAKEEAGEDGHDSDDAANDDNNEEGAKAGDKRKKAGNRSKSNGSAKKQKSAGNGKGGNAPAGKVGSKHMDADEPAPRGSADRLPKKGQKIVWKAMPGWVDGVVTEVLTKGKKVDKKDVKASKDDPKIVMKSNSSGKICVHKPEACCYE